MVESFSSSSASLRLPHCCCWSFLTRLAEWRWKLGHWGFVAQTTTDCSLIQQLQDIKSSPSYRFVLSHLREYKHLYWVKLMFWPVKKVMVRNYAFLAPINVCFCSPFLLYGELCNLHVTRVSNWQIKNFSSLSCWTLYILYFSEQLHTDALYVYYFCINSQRSFECISVRIL